MRTNETQGPVIKDRDPHLAAWNQQKLEAAQRRELYAARLENPEYFQSDAHDFPELAWEDVDDHLIALAEQVRPYLDGELTAQLRDRLLEEWRPAWLEERERCQREVRMLEKLDEPVPTDLRAKAEDPDLYEAFESWRDEMRKKHARVVTFG